MLNRRLIRIKVFQALFGEFGETSTRPSVIISNVQKSMTGMASNLLSVLSFAPEFSHFIASEHNPSEFKYKPTEEDLKSFSLFTDNTFLKQLEANKEVAAYRARPTLDWQQEKDIMFIIYKDIKKTDAYQAAVAGSLKTEAHQDFVLFLFKYLLLESMEFEQLMEDKNIYWYDEKIPILKSIESLFASYKQFDEIRIPSLFKNKEEDLQMSEDLITKYFEHKTELEQSLNDYTPGWDSERITKIDYVLMLMALLEFKYMPMIPVKVTLNEYIEIAKMYSTPKSSKFLNGTLDKILKDWTSNNQINKKGRGLIG
jgi:N utilization substance protein B